MKISIITVCYNDKDVIEKTILSVINQDYSNLEYIIVDGASSDGTLEIIKQYQKKYPIILISEKDDGIYDAMNKGSKVASGDYLNFMNAGDYFFSDNTISAVVPHLYSGEGIVYGDTEIRYDNFKIIASSKDPQNLWRGPINHQSTFISRPVMTKYGYNIKNKIVADFEFFLNAYYNGETIKKINVVIASFANNGISQSEDKQVVSDCLRTVKQFKKGLRVELHYKVLSLKPLFKKILPRRIFKILLNNFK